MGYSEDGLIISRLNNCKAGLFWPAFFVDNQCYKLEYIKNNSYLPVINRGYILKNI